MQIHFENDEFGTFEFDDRKVELLLQVGGDGLWSSCRKPVRVTRLAVHGMNHAPQGEEEHLAGELRVFFDTATWVIRNDGVIYTDQTFLAGLRSYLGTLVPQEAASDIGYSERGMQGIDFVSLDVGPAFIQGWKLLAARERAREQDLRNAG